MRRLCLLAASAGTMFAQLSLDQLAAPNDVGVSMGHIHLTVPDPDAQIKVWVDVLGATAAKAGPLNLVKLPGIFIIVTKSTTATEGSDGSTVNHIGFLVKDYAGLETKLAAANIPNRNQGQQENSNRFSHSQHPLIRYPRPLEGPIELQPTEDQTP